MELHHLDLDDNQMDMPSCAFRRLIAPTSACRVIQPLVGGRHRLRRAEQGRHRQRRRVDRVLDRVDDVVRDLAVLADEGEVGGARRDDRRSVAGRARHELAGRVGQQAGHAVRALEQRRQVVLPAEVRDRPRSGSRRRCSRASSWRRSRRRGRQTARSPTRRASPAAARRRPAGGRGGRSAASSSPSA